MNAKPDVYINRANPGNYDAQPINLGDIFPSWCSKCKNRTDHLYDKRGLTCLVCHPEQRPRKEAQDETLNRQA